MTQLESEPRKEEYSLQREIRNTSFFVGGLIVLIIGALMVAEGVLGWVTGTSLLYEGVNPNFKFVVGFISIILASALMSIEIPGSLVSRSGTRLGR